ncbi:MAG: UDP-2,3-diacylglucosamine diphosphatase [Gammaproteobacteria bacterium]|nr:UDP-2,3-diacylglucosamine diphosphatase [Gammaproteobacteria bacterium]
MHAPSPNRLEALFASDVHLSANRPQAVQRFFALLDRAVAADALYLLGDIFDLWLGDDDDRVPHPHTLDRLAALARTTPVYIIRGNHDFLLGSAFADRTGCTLLADPSVIELGGKRVLLMHGDTLCTEDVEYQAYREHVHRPEVQRAFLAQSLDDRLRYATDLSERSRTHTAHLAETITDVSITAVEKIVAAHQADILIHGHTHRPARHDIQRSTGTPGQRIVLSDWYALDNVLAFDGQFVDGPLDSVLPPQP